MKQSNMKQMYKLLYNLQNFCKQPIKTNKIYYDMMNVSQYQQLGKPSKKPIKTNKIYYDMMNASQYQQLSKRLK